MSAITAVLLVLGGFFLGAIVAVLVLLAALGALGDPYEESIG